MTDFSGLRSGNLFSSRYPRLEATEASCDKQRLMSVSATIPTPLGEFVMCCYETGLATEAPVTLVRGGPFLGREPLVRVHSACFTGDVFASARCDCGEQLRLAMHLIAEADCGALIYLRDHEGRGIGLLNKLRAYQLQDAGEDTVDANLALGLPPDARTYSMAALILRDLDACRIRLLTNNPDKVVALTKLGITVVERVPLEVPASEDNFRYLATKKFRLGHHLDLLSSRPHDNGHDKRRIVDETSN